MKNRWLYLGFWGIACTLSSQALFAFNGHGFNDLTGIYQWDNGRHGSVTTIATDIADGFGPFALRGNNAQSIAQGFDTRHHNSLATDTIVAVQFGFTDTTDSFHSRECRDGDQGATIIPTAGQTVTIGIWPGTVAAGNQRRDNAIYLQDYTIQPEDIVGTEPSSVDATSDVGITSNFVSPCPQYNFPIGTGSPTAGTCACVGPDGPTGATVPPKVPFCIAEADCPAGSETQPLPGLTGCGCIFQGNGSNIRPLVAPFFAPCGVETQLSCGCCFNGSCSTGCTGGCTGPFCPPVDTAYEATTGIDWLLFPQDHIRRPEAPCQNAGPGGRNPFSEYGTIFTTINLDQAVQVSGEFWVGILYDMPNFPLDAPSDDLLLTPIGISTLDFCDPQPQPNGIDLTGLLRFDGSCCLTNNEEVEITPSNPEGLHPIANGFSPITTVIFVGGSFAGREDEFYSIRAIPQNSLWWNQ